MMEREAMKKHDEKTNGKIETVGTHTHVGYKYHFYA